jgi:hypothetical protein
VVSLEACVKERVEVGLLADAVGQPFGGGGELLEGLPFAG